MNRIIKLAMMGGQTKASLRSKILGMQSPNLIAYWPMDDAVGTISIKNIAAMSGNLSKNGGFEFATLIKWTKTLASGAIDLTTAAGEYNAGSGSIQAIKITSVGGYTYANQFIPVRNGETYLFSCWTRGDGTNAGKVQLQNNDGSTVYLSYGSTGVTGTDYAHFTFSFTVSANVTGLIGCKLATNINGATVYFDDVSITCTSNPSADFDGKVVGLTYAQAGYSGNAVSCDGTSSIVDIASDGLISRFNGIEGSFLIYGNVAAAVWNDSTQRFLFKLKTTPTGSPNFTDCYKSETENKFGYQYGNDADDNLSSEQTPGAPYIGWFSAGATWSVAAQKWCVYWNGVKVDEKAITAASTWTRPFNMDILNLFSDSGAQNWKGLAQHCALWNTPLTENEMYYVGKV